VQPFLQNGADNDPSYKEGTFDIGFREESKISSFIIFNHKQIELICDWINGSWSSNIYTCLSHWVAKDEF
jgi:hypothetical protein